MRWILFLLFTVNLFAQDTVINKETDQFTGITWHKPHKNEIAGNGFYLYFGVKSDTVELLRAKVYYHGSGWIFFTNMTVLVKGKTYNYEFNRYDRKDDAEGYGVTETYDFPVAQYPGFKQMLADMEGVDTVKIRLSGEKSYDFALTKQQIQLINKYNWAYLNLVETNPSSEKKTANPDSTSVSAESLIAIFFLAFMVFIVGTIYISVKNAKNRRMQEAILKARYEREVLMRDKGE